MTAKAKDPDKKKGKIGKFEEALKKKFKGVEIIVRPEYYNKGGIPSGSRMLDMNLGPQRGWPRGRVIEIYGPEQSGKTTLCLHAIKSEQQQEGIPVLIDLEKFDPDYAAAIGVDVDDLTILKPNESSQVLDSVIEATKLGATLLVIDSVAAMAPKKELEGAIGDDTIGIVARHMAKGLRNVLDPAFDSGVTVMFINQVRAEIGGYGGGLTTPGGRALRQFASVRVQLGKAEPIRVKREVEKDELDGSEVEVIRKRKTTASSWYNVPQKGHGSKITIIKNKVAAPMRKLEVDILYGQGIDQEADAFDLGMHLGIINSSGSWYKYFPNPEHRKTEEGEVLKAQDKYDLIDLIIRKGMWDKVMEEVDKAWEHVGILQPE